MESLIEFKLNLTAKLGKELRDIKKFLDYLVCILLKYECLIATNIRVEKQVFKERKYEEDLEKSVIEKTN